MSDTVIRPDREQILDLLRCQLREVLTTLRPLSPLDVDMRAWGETLDIGTPPVALDSLERMSLAGNVNRLFSLDDTGLEDYLLRRRRLGEWADIIQAALVGNPPTSGMRFLTSGSTGRPREHAHSWRTLEEEARFFADQFQDRGRIICLTPRQHVYGFLFGVMLPRALAVPVRVEQMAEASLNRAELRPDDLIVAFPARWRYLNQSLGGLPAGIQGVTSTGPCEPALIDDLLAKGLARMTEVHGATETAGLGYRHHHEAAYRLLPWWQKREGGLSRGPGAEAATTLVTPPDELAWEGGEHYRPVGRRDDVVQVGGVNVSTGHVAERLREHAGVKEAVVRLNQAGRLKAFVVPAESVDQGTFAAELMTWLRERMVAAECPVSVTLGASLPRNGMGKLADWA